MTKTKSTTDKSEDRVIILFSGKSPKLTARGKGELTYELGVNDSTKESFIRIAENSEGGSCSNEWIDLQVIRSVLEPLGNDNQTFSATLFSRGVFTSRSQNNHGFLAAILRTEKVIANADEHLTQLVPRGFTEITAKVESLKKKGVDLTDHVAIKLAEREEKKKQRLAAKKKAAGPKPECSKDDPAKKSEKSS
jgi:hypothetical protein